MKESNDSGWIICHRYGDYEEYVDEYGFSTGNVLLANIYTTRQKAQLECHGNEYVKFFTVGWRIEDDKESNS